MPSKKVVKDKELLEEVVKKEGTTEAVKKEGTTEFVEEKKKTTKDEKIIGVVNCEGLLNIRKYPSIDAVILGTLQKSDKICIDGEKEGWYHYSLDNGTTGYSMKEFIDKQ